MTAVIVIFIILIVIIVGYPILGILAIITDGMYDPKHPVTSICAMFILFVWPFIYLYIFMTEYKNMLRYDYEWAWSKIGGVGVLAGILSIVALIIVTTILSKIAIIIKKINKKLGGG